MTPELVCFGNFTIDDVVLPDGTERPGCTGGDALYATLAARAWEPECQLVAPVGHDLPPSVTVAMGRAGLSFRGMVPRDLPTLHNRVEYFSDGSREWTLFADPATFDALSPLPSDIPADWRQAQAFLILAMTLDAQERLVADLRATTTALIALDPQEDYIAGNEARLRRLVSQVDIFLPSAEEVRRLLNTEDWEQAARDLAALGPQIVVVKLGEDGCLVHDRRNGLMQHLPARAVPHVVDTTGAGDSFCGAFMAALLDNPTDPLRAARAGALAASITVQGYGADPLFACNPADLRAQFDAGH